VREQLANHPRSSGPQREPHRNFMALTHSAGQHERGDIGAGDEENHSNDAHQD